MKTLSFAITILLLVGLPAARELARTNQANPNQQTQSADLAEADRLEALAAVQFSKHDYKQAAELLKSVLVIREKSFGEKSPDLTKTLHGLANVYYKAGKSKGGIVLPARAYDSARGGTFVLSRVSASTNRLRMPAES